jgi:hypothetical protein
MATTANALKTEATRIRTAGKKSTKTAKGKKYSGIKGRKLRIRV